MDVKRFSWYRERVARRDIVIVLPGGGLTVAFSRLLSALPFPFSGSGFSAPRPSTPPAKNENPKQIWQRDFPFFYAIFLSIRVLWFLRFFVDFILPSSFSLCGSFFPPITYRIRARFGADSNEVNLLGERSVKKVAQGATRMRRHLHKYGARNLPNPRRPASSSSTASM